MERFDPCRDDDAFAIQFGDPHCACVPRDLFAMKLCQAGEDRLLDRLLHHLPLAKTVVAGAGDDCAVVEMPAGSDFLVLKTDCIVEGVHFLPGASPLDIGWKAVMRPLSDFAAVSAVPQFALITLIASKQTEIEWVKRLYRGLSLAAKRFEVSIVGGKAGDDLFVTGRLGGALKRKHLQFVPRIAESRWLTKNFSIRAMMDLSDGLGVDLPRLARASKVGFTVEMENLPLTSGAKIGNAISEGEDYELLFAISPRQSKRLQREWRKGFPKLPLTHIGQLNRKSKIENQNLPRGYVHFQQPD